MNRPVYNGPSVAIRLSVRICTWYVFSINSKMTQQFFILHRSDLLQRITCCIYLQTKLYGEIQQNLKQNVQTLSATDSAAKSASATKSAAKSAP